MTRKTSILHNLEDLRAWDGRHLPGPMAIVLDEDGVELVSTLAHLRGLGFRSILLFTAPRRTLPERETVDLRIDWTFDGPAGVADAVNAVIAAAPGRWMHYCFNAEYLFFPFCETRRIGEMLAFHDSERRDALLTCVVDLYAADCAETSAVDRDTAHLDSAGYYAIARREDRQLDLFGGLRWRFEEHVPAGRRRINRIGLFRSRQGLLLRPDHTFDDPEYNTISCPWHHNLTAAICSFRAAKALAGNPSSRDGIATFMWHRSAPFEWRSTQLLDLGLIEPGQWV